MAGLSPHVGGGAPFWYELDMVDQPRAIVDNRFSKIQDEDPKAQIIQSMRYLSDHGELDFAEALLIRKDGSEELKKVMVPTPIRDQDRAIINESYRIAAWRFRSTHPRGCDRPSFQ